ncbi:DHHA1 domain-containing protein [Halobaculum sp. MBLA0147]|uniref:DHHA1 domain-containing protein n=1 Tax=Halobaculum sp. MBLA0147 TaxID=3079934 RepID=UPI003523F4F3
MTLGEVDPDPSPETPPVPELADRAAACAERLAAADEVLLASHIDADGLTSAAVASTALRRAGLPFETTFFDQLDEAAVAQVAATDYDTVLFTDFGSGQLDAIVPHEAAGAFTPVIADHHQPADAETEFHLNPLLVGLDGASELSGAGAAYVLARALEDAAGSPATTAPRADGGTTALAGGPTAGPPPTDNRDLAGLAVVGAVGDMQDSDGGLTGANRRIVAEGVAAGVLEEQTDIAMYGRQTRPLPKLFEYASDVRIPGISNDEHGAIEFLQETGVDLKVDDEWRRWVDLDGDERQTVASALLRRAVASGVPSDQVEQLIGTTYVLADEEPGTELRDVSEFSTLLNATARYERADVGLAVCLGDRDAALERARTLLRQHRRNLSEGVELVQTEGVTTADHVQWFDAGTRIRETIVGIVAGMAMGGDGISRSRPILAFAEKTESEVKVSARGTHRLVRRGLDLSTVMSEAAAAVDGEGGGHDVAAGATIPAESRDAFLARVDEIVGRQLGDDSVSTE